MTLFQAFILGLVQGLTEFLPISSSGHLTLVPFIVGWDEPSVTFNVAVHVGTLIAVVWYFRDLVARYALALVRWRDAPAEDKRVVRLLAVGTAPAVVLGGLFNSAIEDAFQRPVLVSLLLGVTGYILFSAESRAEAATLPRARDTMSDTDALLIGTAQAAAILPGISRSGATIATGMFRGFDRVDAARFSFLLSIPVIVGAAVFQLPDFLATPNDYGEFAVGMAASALSGLLAIRWLIGFLSRRGLRPFGIYAFLAMIAGLLTALARG